MSREPPDRRDPIDPVRNVDGLRLFVDTVPSPVVSAHLWFDVGAADEQPHEHGAAHFLEHMLFKGTERRGVGEVAAAIEGLGGDLNAYTSWDETCFFATVEADAWREALDVLFDMARHARLDPDELERERLVILDEVAGYADDPDAVAADTLVALRYGDHPYGRPVLGGAEAVRRLDRDTLTTFWRSHYHPGRAILVISGPVPADEAERATRRHLQGWAHGRDRAPLAAAPRRAGGTRHLDDGFEARTVQLAWPAPPLGHPDLPALDVLAAALGQGASSLLPRVLELEAGVATRSWASVDAQRRGGTLEVGFQPTDTVEAIEAALDVLDRAWRSGLDGEAVARAREGLRTDQLFATETVEGRAGEWVQAIAHRGGPEALEADRRALAAVTSDDVRRVARALLGPDHRSAVVVDHQAERTAVSAALRAAPRPPPRAVSQGSEPELLDLHGLKVALLPDGGPLAAARLIVHGGQAEESPRAPGLARLWADTVTRGAGERPAQAFAERMDTLAAWLDGSSGRSSHGLTLSLPADRLELGLELLGDAMLDPHFDPVDVGHALDELREDADSRHDRPDQVASEALWAALWPGHPWRHPSGGTPGSLKRLGTKAVQRFHEQTLTQGRLTLAVAGGFAPDAVLEQLTALAEDLPEAVATAPAPAPGAPRAPRPQAAGTRQAAVVAGVRLEPHHDRDHRLALHVAATLLDSQSGRLFLALREDRGLAYSVWASAELAPAGGRFALGLGCAPDRIDEAAEGLRSVFLRLADDGPGDEELQRALRLLRGGVAMRRQRVVGRASDLAWARHLDRPYGLEALHKRLAALTPHDVRDALQAIGPRALQVAVAAPA